jgi:hypothetical protein
MAADITVRNEASPRFRRDAHTLMSLTLDALGTGLDQDVLRADVAVDARVRRDSRWIAPRESVL